MVIKNKNLVIIGLGETADLAYEYFMYDSNYNVIGFAADKQFIKAKNYLGLPIYDLVELKDHFSVMEIECFVALASGNMNRDREKLFKRIKDYGYKCANYISSKAFIWRNVQIGENCFILENNVLQYKVVIGDNVTLWSGNHIGHQTNIKSHVFVSSHCVISGFCEVGENSFLGVNCTFADNVKIGRDCFIGAGSLLTRSQEPNTFIKIDRSPIASLTPLEFFKIS